MLSPVFNRQLLEFVYFIGTFIISFYKGKHKYSLIVKKSAKINLWQEPQ